MLQTLVPAAPQQPDDLAAEPAEPLWQLAGDVVATRAVVLAEHGLDLLCGLLRRGCPAATVIRPSAKTGPECCDLLLVPLATELSSLDNLVRIARKALAPGGRLIAGIPADANGRTLLALTRRLRLHGFAALRSVRLPGRTLLRAERLPASVGGNST